MKILIKVREIITILLIGAAVFFSSCRTVPLTKEEGIASNVPPSNFTPLWRNYDPGIDFLTYSSKEPRFYLAAVRINLAEEDHEVVVSRGLKPLAEKKEAKELNFTSQTIRQFMAKESVLVAINVTPFQPYRLFSGMRQAAVGIVVSDGILYADNDKYDALFITKNNRVLLKHPPFLIDKEASEGAGGFFIILERGENVAKKSPRAARSLIGTSRNGRILILATIDGENTGTGSGADFYEAAEWMKVLGAENAIDMDGGGSSVMALKKKSTAGICIMNHSDGGWLTYFQRIAPVFLGVK